MGQSSAKRGPSSFGILSTPTQSSALVVTWEDRAPDVLHAARLGDRIINSQARISHTALMRMDTGELERKRAARRGITRRDFVKYSAEAGLTGALASMGILSALGIVRGPQEPVPEWEVEPSVVDYSLVPEGPSGPTPYTLKVAQWYDYWPGKFLEDFRDYIGSRYGYSVEIKWDVYTSNEELFHWITLGKRRYDVIFPSNYMVDLLKKVGLIYTLNETWLPNVGPNFSYMMQDLVNTPQEDPYDRRGPNGPWVSVPYFWGTTGIGFRTDQIPRQDAVELGWDVFWKPSYQPNAPGMPRVDLVKKMRMLDDLRDVIGAGLKKAGWEWQKEFGQTPTGLYPPDGPQWSQNETDPIRLNAAGDWLRRGKPLLFGYNSTDQAGSLASGVATVNQAWSGDMMYAIRPDTTTPLPVDYIIPRQGSTWWVDCAAIHSKSRNLWLAHEFVNFTQDIQKHIMLTRWNLYSTPNQRVYDDYLQPPWFDFPSGWVMKEDPRLYPNIYAKEDFRFCEITRDVGLNTLLSLYNPLWFDLATT